MIYWDTSCAIKLYVEEAGSLMWQEFAASLDEPLVSSALLSAELGIALARKEQQGGLRPGGAARLLLDFQRDTAKGIFQILPVSPGVLEQSVCVAAKCLRAARPVKLRTLDALHLATALEARANRLATADERMMQAAALLGIRTIKAN